MKKIIILLALTQSLGLLVACGSGGGSKSPPSPSNSAPTADAGSDQGGTTGATITLDGSASSDADGDSLSYSWQQVEGDTLVALSDEQAAQPEFTVPEVSDTEVLTFELTVNDGKLDSAPDSVQITIEPPPSPAPQRPTANAGSDQNVHEGNTVMLDATNSSDPEGAALSYSWQQVSGTSVVLSDPQIAQPQFTAPEVSGAETLTFELTVNDGDLDSTAETVEISVSEPTKVAFDPLGSGQVPFPNNWFFEGGTDGRLNIPGDAFVQQLNLLDGFSTINPIRVEFDQKLDADSIAAGDNVRVFEATIDSDTREVISINRELQAGTDYIVEMSRLPEAIGSEVLDNKRLLIKPLLPFKASTGTGDATGYVVFVTKGLLDIYGLPVETTEAFEAVRGSADLSGGTLAALETLRQQTVGWTQLLDSYMPMPVLNTDDVVVSFSFTTVSTTDALQAVSDNATAGSYSVDSPKDSQSNSIVDVYTGGFTVPNYIDSTTKLWLDASGNRVTRYDPMPVQQGTVSHSFHAALPVDPACGSKPSDGWPVVIFAGGRNSSSIGLIAHFGSSTATSLTTIADDLGQRCLASISIGHFVSDNGPRQVDAWRQAVSDLVYLVKTLPSIDLDGDSEHDFDGNNISLIGHSAGADLGILLAAVEPAIRAIAVSGPDAGIAKALDGSPLRARNLESSLAPENQKGSAAYESILNVIQANNDPFDPLNYIGKIRPSQAFHLIEVYGGGILPGDIGTGVGSGYMDDQGNFLNPGDLSQPSTVLNQGFGQVVETAPLAGVESIARVLELTTAGATIDNVSSGEPIKSIVRFTRGHHSSGYVLEFLGFGTLGVSEEWRNQQAEFVASGGLYLPVDTSPQNYVLPTAP